MYRLLVPFACLCGASVHAGCAVSSRAPLRLPGQLLAPLNFPAWVLSLEFR